MAGLVGGMVFSSPASAHDLKGLFARPVITAISPPSGSTGGGAEVTITGTSLSLTLLVTFGELPGVITSVSRTSLTVRTPPHSAGTVDVRVWALTGVSKTTDASRYTYVALEPVTMLSVEQSTTSGFRLSWANPFSEDFQGVMIRRNTGSWAPTIPFSGTLAGQTSGYTNRWTDSGRTRGQTYSYSVFADYGPLGFAEAASLTVTVPARDMMTGTVRDAAGTPIPGVMVVVLDSQGVAAADTTTGSDGTYAIAGLAAGDYTVCFEPDNAGGTGFGYRRECWSDVAPDDEATPVTLNPSMTVTEIDAALDSAGVISGRVTDAAGQPITDVAVSIDDEFGSPLANAFTGDDGTWRAVGLEPGRYSVCFDPRTAEAAEGYAAQCYPGRAPAETPEAITVSTGAEVSGIDAVLEPPAAGPTAARRTAGVGAATAQWETIPSVRLRDVPCADIMFLAARGSGEAGPGGDKDRANDPYAGIGARLHPAYEAFRASISDPLVVTPPLSVFYPAESTDVLLRLGTQGAFTNSLNLGVFQARFALRLRAEICPAERFVIAGYSQGAMVMHRVLHNEYSPGAEFLSEEVLDRIDAALLIADGDQVPYDIPHWQFSSARTSAIGLGLLGTTFLWDDIGTVAQWLPPAIGRRTVSVCVIGDFVCDANLDFDRGMRIHSMAYTNSPRVLAAANFAASIARQYGPPDPMITTSELRPATVGRSYIEPLATSDDRLGSWAVVGGSLPDGLELTTAPPHDVAVIDGVPTTTGTSTFTLQFTDHYGQTATAELSLTVEEEPPPPPPPARPDNLSDLPLPADAAPGQTAEIETASCGPNVCAAAGGYTDAAGHTQEALWLWSDEQWTVTKAPMPTDSTGAGVRAELSSCGADTCTIWGRYDGESPGTPVAWTWFGGSWTVGAMTPPDVGHPASAYVDTLSCGAGVCAASGAYSDESGTARTVLWAWSDGSWTSAPVPLPDGTPPGGEYVLYLSCGTGICVAGGVSERFPTTIHAAWSWSDGSWTLATADVLSPTAAIWNTACLDDTCFVVGAFDDASTGLRQYRDGWWSPVTLPGSAGPPSPSLLWVDDIACGADLCAAPGSYVDTDFEFHRVLWTWSGLSWLAAEMPLEVAPTAVSCGTEICAATAADAWWVQTNGITSLVEVPSDAVTGSDADPTCGTEMCAFVGTYEDAGEWSHAIWLLLDGWWWRGQLPPPADNISVHVDTLTCGAGHCLVGATYEDADGGHRVWWSWAGPRSEPGLSASR